MIVPNTDEVAAALATMHRVAVPADERAYTPEREADLRDALSKAAFAHLLMPDVIDAAIAGGTAHELLPPEVPPGVRILDEGSELTLDAIEAVADLGIRAVRLYFSAIWGTCERGNAVLRSVKDEGNLGALLQARIDRPCPAPYEKSPRPRRPDQHRLKAFTPPLPSLFDFQAELDREDNCEKAHREATVECKSSRTDRAA